MNIVYIYIEISVLGSLWLVADTGWAVIFAGFRVNFGSLSLGSSRVSNFRAAGGWGLGSVRELPVTPLRVRIV